MITAENIKDVLSEYIDEKFKNFTSALIPGSRLILGVRVPILRKIAKEIAKGDWQTYLKEAPEDTYEEVAIKGFVIGYAKEGLEGLLPYGKIDDEFKQREKTFVYMQNGNNILDDWTYNKAIQKMLESYRVSDEDKKLLRTMKRI